MMGKTSVRIKRDNIEKQKAFIWEEFNQIEPGLRKARWNEFKAVFPAHAAEWEQTEACDESECTYQIIGWCEYTDFPCAYNPYFTPRTGIIGMACMGLVPRRNK